jgi:hypothetical protein
VASYEIYCDESRQELFYDKEKARIGYTLIGGIWLEADSRQRLKDEIRKVRVKHDLYSEFKWVKVSPNRLPFYTDIIDLFFREEAFRFRTIVLKNDELDKVKFHEGDAELMFYKFYYQLIKHWLSDGNAYRVFVDMKTNREKDRLPTLLKYLSLSNLSSDVKSVQALPSSEVDFLQVADLLIGAVGSKFNGDGTSCAKLELISSLEKLLGRPLNKPTSCDCNKFNVFRFQPERAW